MADKLLKSITFPDLTDKYIIGDTSLSVSGAGADSKTVGDALAEKANIDGSYEGMTVGNAEQLVSNVRVNDKTPYLFRTSGGSVDIGDREYINGIVGGTVAWNQVLDNNSNTNTNHSITYTKNGDGSWTISGTASGVAFYAMTSGSKKVSGHKYLVLYGIEAVANSYRIGDFNDGDSVKSGVSGTVFQASTPSIAFGVQVYDGVTVNMTIFPQMFDLTQMFGSTIADYIYSLETANAGAGVAFFKKLFNKPYYAYNAGELKSVSGLVSHDMTGFNQWDEEWELGQYVNATGQKYPSTSKIRNVNPIRVLPNTAYYYHVGTTTTDEDSLFFYDAEMAFIKRQAISHGDTINISFTTPQNCAFVNFCVKNTTYHNDICINIAWDNSRNGEYEPYELHSYPLDSTLTLRGIPKLDANNNLYYDGDVYESDGTVTRKYGIVDLGSLTWAYNSNIPWFYSWTDASSRKATASSDLANVATAKYVTFKHDTLIANDVKGICIDSSGSVVVRDSAYTDAATFKTAMSGVYLVYELATPTTETADPYQTPQIVNDFGTEEFIISDNTFAVPVGHDTEYPVNLVAKLEMAPNSPEGDGDYIVRQTNGTNEYVPLVIEDALPTIPSTAGTYKLTVTVASGSDPVLSWEAE